MPVACLGAGKLFSNARTSALPVSSTQKDMIILCLTLCPIQTYIKCLRQPNSAGQMLRRHEKDEELICNWSPSFMVLNDLPLPDANCLVVCKNILGKTPIDRYLHSTSLPKLRFLILNLYGLTEFEKRHP